MRSNHVTFWKRRNFGDSRGTSGRQAPGGAEVNGPSTEDHQSSGNTMWHLNDGYTSPSLRPSPWGRASRTKSEPSCELWTPGDGEASAWPRRS